MKSKQTLSANPFVGTWHIYEMSNWGEDYFNMEVQAYIQIEDNGTGEFQFGLVCGSFNGKIKKVDGQAQLSFLWEGSDEMDETHGSGWLKLSDQENEIEGVIELFSGDESTFNAQKAD